MHLVLIGLSHKTAPVEVREKLSLSKAQLPIALARLKHLGSVSECVVLSTCNRMEVYAYVGDQASDMEIMAHIAESCAVSPQDFMPCIYTKTGHRVTEHLFRVAAGIDSMVLGESQILGQIKDAYAAASLASATGPVLNALFKQALTVGKKVRTETNISRGMFSVGSAAARLASSMFDTLEGRTVLVVGAGKMAELTIGYLSSLGASQVLVTNRTYAKAQKLADQFEGRPIRFQNIPSAMESVDVVVTSTGGKEPIITEGMVSSAMRARRGRPIFLIDIAVPRDVEERTARIDNVFLYNIDDLQAVVAADSASRRAEVEKVESIIEQEVEQFMTWFRALDAVPVITALRDKLESIRLAEVEKLSRRLPHLSGNDVEAINAATRSILNRICHQPMIRIKEYAAGEDWPSRLETICEAFGISPDGNGEEKEKLGID